MSAMGSGGAVLILWLVSPTITAFLAWQLAVAILQAGVLRWCLWRSLPAAGDRPRFSPALLRNVWRFAAGMRGIAVSTIILTQLDKILLSKLLPLKTFGYYTLATAVGNGLYILITPVFNATFPRLSALVAMRDGEGVRGLYHRGTQLMAALVLPFAAVLAFFPDDVLRIWTGSAETALAAAPIVRFLVIGTAVNGIMSLPYALQLAHGWTNLGLMITVALIFTMVPSIYVASLHFGAAGAASVWAVLNLIYMAIGVPLTHWKLLPGDARRWFLGDLAVPLTVSVLATGIARRFFTLDPTRGISSAIELGGLLAIVFLLTASASPVLRNWAAEQWRGLGSLNA
jgi:O-antigen/teichoic acid export membrane protein